MRDLKKFRTMMAGLLCGGLLLVGIGFGVGFGEFSRFSYGGTSTLNGMETRTSSEKLTLEDGEVLHLSPRCSFYGAFRFYYMDPLQGFQMETDSMVAPGTVLIQTDYRSVYSTVQLRFYASDQIDGVLHQRAELCAVPDSTPLAVIMAYKNQVLADLHRNTLADYEEIQVDRVVVTVNPADAHRVILNPQ